ncbi:fibropellin-1-like [Dreissena polymorpha]|nr:fibropellin-1-like [Dreissena polymorpha]
MHSYDKRQLKDKRQLRSGNNHRGQTKDIHYNWGKPLCCWNSYIICTSADIDECASAPCQNNATCFDLVNEYFCGCHVVYSGVNCQTDIDECLLRPCKNGVTCNDQIGWAKCTCKPGFTDEVCQTDIDECAGAPCQNNATCFDLINEYFCGCHVGYNGVNCQTDIDECLLRPCKNGGTCNDQIGWAKCTCKPGFTGEVCQTDIDECASAPCQNNATCFDLINEYFCGCHVGYSGVNCQTDIDECLLRPCKNGGTCTDQIGWAKCTCKPGFTGEVCQTGLDACESRPCQNGGTCSYHVSFGYACQCGDSWLGRNCEYRYENDTFLLGNITQMTSSYMHYSACDCVVAERRQDRCYQYSRSKHAGYGFLSAIAGIITAILLYILFDAISNKTLCCYQKTNMVQMEKTIPENKVVLHVVEPTEPEPKVETLEKLEAPRIRKHHCWACEVKYNKAPIPAWYKQGSRTNKH